MTRPIRILPWLSAAVLTGCILSKQETSHPVVAMEVLPYMVPCSIVIFPGACQVAKESGGAPVRLPGKIEGMDFEWGYRHFLEAEKVPYPPDWQDVPTHKYVAHGPTTRTLDTAWEFQTVLLDTQDFTLSADTLTFVGYPKAVLIPDPADRALIASAAWEKPVRITVRPRGGSLLVGSEAARDGVETLEMEIQPYLRPCTGLGPRSCLAIRETGDSADQFLYDGIEGFRFEWGVRHVLRVEKHRVPDPPADGSSIRYVAAGVLSRSPDTAWEFETVLRGTRDWTLSKDTLSLEGFRRIRFPAEADVRKLEAMKDGDMLRFRVKEGADTLLEGRSTAFLP